MIVYTVYFENYHKTFIGTPTAVFQFLVGQNVSYEEARKACNWCERAAIGDYYQSDNFDIETDIIE